MQNVSCKKHDTKCMIIYYICSVKKYKMKQRNPFPVVGYYGYELFCDREKEIHNLIRNLNGGINTTLISVRRMGKTALIYRVFDEILKGKQSICLYVDLYPTRNIKDLTRQLATAALKELPQKRSAGKRFSNFIKGFRPVITYDPLTGAPEVRFEYAAVSDYESTISAMLTYLDGQELSVHLAFDEFQVIATYDEGNAEALLRSLIQPLKNTHFIFSGSNKHMMSEIFSNSKRPFFASTRLMSLTSIPEKNYAVFISDKFSSGKREITGEAIDFILDWTRRHTYYTQSVCNTIYSSGAKLVDIQKAKSICGEILGEQEKSFLQYRHLLTSNQWQALMGVAKEGKVYQPQSGEFIQKYSLGSPASSKRAFDALNEKEMLYEENDKTGSYYSVYDLFLSRWLERQ